MMTNATIGDESGKIKLLLWDQQVNAVAMGDTIEIKNASVSTFKGEKQLRLGKTGTLTVTQSGVSKQKRSGDTDAKKVVCAP
jgi:replication factor A1